MPKVWHSARMPCRPAYGSGFRTHMFHLFGSRARTSQNGVVSEIILLGLKKQPSRTTPLKFRADKSALCHSLGGHFVVAAVRLLLWSAGGSGAIICLGESRAARAAPTNRPATVRSIASSAWHLAVAAAGH